MTEYRFTLIVKGPFSKELTDEELLDATDALGGAGCDDALISAHPIGLELEFDRVAPNLDTALSSAVRSVESVSGFKVESIAMNRESALSMAS